MPAIQRVLILNAGSSSIKWSVLDVAGPAVISDGNHSWSDADPAAHQADIEQAIRGLPRVYAAGHRVVHGGDTFRQATRINTAVRQAIADLAPLAPLHNPAALAGIDAVTAAFPGLPQVAAFDTAFHASMPEAAALYALPWEWSAPEQDSGMADSVPNPGQRRRDTPGVPLRRYGFHGLSISYAIRRATQMLGGLPPRALVCHLGAGCSLTAVAQGRSIDTSMGFTPMDGVVMARRPGTVDPGLLLFILQHRDMDVDDLDRALNEQSGLLGLSGVSADLREVRSAADAGNRRATIACAVFICSIVRTAGAMIASLGGLDTLIFTGGIGEHAAWVRRDVAAALTFIGLRLDDAANEAARGDADIAAAGSAVRALVITAREDLAILHELRRVLGDAAPGASPASA